MTRGTSLSVGEEMCDPETMTRQFYVSGERSQSPSGKRLIATPHQSTSSEARFAAMATLMAAIFCKGNLFIYPSQDVTAICHDDGQDCHERKEDGDDDNRPKQTE